MDFIVDEKYKLIVAKSINEHRIWDWCKWIGNSFVDSFAHLCEA